MGFDRDCSHVPYVCVYLTRIVCVWRVRRSHHHQCTTGLTVIPMSIFIYIHEPLHGFAYAHYCTHKRKYGGVGFRNESFPQVEILPQLFHPHTYALSTTWHLQPPSPSQNTPQTPPNPWYYHILTPYSLFTYLPLQPPYNPPIGGHGFRISTFSTSIMGTYRIPSRTDPHTPLNFRLLFLVFTDLP